MILPEFLPGTTDNPQGHLWVAGEVCRVLNCSFFRDLKHNCVAAVNAEGRILVTVL